VTRITRDALQFACDKTRYVIGGLATGVVLGYIVNPEPLSWLFIIGIIITPVTSFIGLFLGAYTGMKERERRRNDQGNKH
jgi:hypothetical protein